MSNFVTYCLKPVWCLVCYIVNSLHVSLTLWTV